MMDDKNGTTEVYSGIAGVKQIIAVLSGKFAINSI